MRCAIDSLPLEFNCDHLLLARVRVNDVYVTLDPSECVSFGHLKTWMIHDLWVLLFENVLHN